MRIGLISDLHIDYLKQYQPHQLIDELVRICHEKMLAYLIIGGDISNHYGDTLNFVDALEKALSPIGVYYIPGNHDYWQNHQSEKTTWQIHKLFKEHPQSLMHQPLLIGDNLAIVGHMGWYNHAFYDRNQFTSERIATGRYKIATWQDKKRLDWGATDQEISQLFTQEIEADLQSVSDREIILVTHIVTTPALIMPMPHRTFDFFNAFIATDDLTNVVTQYPITHNVMGHVHFRHHIQDNGMKWITNSLAYEKEWRTHSMRHEIESALYIIDLDHHL